MSNQSKFSDGANVAHGKGSNYPKFGIDVRLDSKLDEDDNPFFRMYDASKPEGEREVKITTPVTGPLIGMAMRLEGYDKNTKTGYSSTPYFANNNRVAVFARGGVDSGKKVFDGHADEAADWIRKNAENCKKRRLFFIASLKKSKGKNEVKIVEITSNLTMSIEEINNDMKEILKSHTIILTPVRFDKRTKLSKEGAKALDSLITNKKMEMGYAKVSKGMLIDDKMWDEYIAAGRNLKDIQNEYISWMEFVKSGGQQEHEGRPQHEIHQESPITNEEYFGEARDVRSTSSEVANEDFGDDLPF